ncbi:MAG: sigma-70 family RNA polymerase sigma factor [Elusimicrobiota bacterium]
MDPSDLELVERVRSGESAAYAELVRRHHGDVFGLCLSMLGGAAEADDAAQDVFLKAYRSLDRFRNDASLRTWLYRIASNRCLDLLRSRARDRSESLEAILESEGGRLKDLLPVESDSSQAAENADLVERVLRQLSPEYRLILTLREGQGLDYEELAEAMGCSLDSVKARLKRARAVFEGLLRHLLQPDDV